MVGEAGSIAEEVERHIKDVLGAGNVNVSCRKLKKKFDTYSSFHVKVIGEEEVIRDVRCLLEGGGWMAEWMFC